MKTDALNSLPALGALWPEQGGYFAGITQDSAGATFAVIVAVENPDSKFKMTEWGGYGKDAPGATHWTDGLANTRALAAAKTGHPAADVCTAHTHEGHADWYLPSIGELQLAHMHCRAMFDAEGYYWSSTQDGRYFAWVQDFESGDSDGSSKGRRAPGASFPQISTLTLW